jgi:hypothetical protein
MLLDGDSSHTADSSRNAADDLGIELIWLPVRSPKLNPMEALWGMVKDDRCANHQYENIDDEMYQVIEYLETMPNRTVLKAAGILSQDFWLRL